MGHPRWELSGREMGRGIYTGDGAGDGTSKRRRIYHMTWDFQDFQGRNWQVGNMETGREMGRIYHRDLPPGREMGRWGIQGGNWQVGRWEEEFTAGDGTSKGDEFTT